MINGVTRSLCCTYNNRYTKPNPPRVQLQAVTRWGEAIVFDTEEVVGTHALTGEMTAHVDAIGAAWQSAQAPLASGAVVVETVEPGHITGTFDWVLQRLADDVRNGYTNETAHVTGSFDGYYPQ